jgi:hypothetical protein
MLTFATLVVTLVTLVTLVTPSLLFLLDPFQFLEARDVGFE